MMHPVAAIPRGLKRQSSDPLTPQWSKRQSLRHELDEEDTSPAKSSMPRASLFAAAATSEDAVKAKCTHSDAAADEDVIPDQYPMVSREQECGMLDVFLERSLGGAPQAKASAGGCLYVSGGPGTGKTCSVRAAVAAWRHTHPDTEVLTVNCMQLSQRSPAGLLKRLAELSKQRHGTEPGARLPPSGAGLVTGVAASISRLGASVVVIADEVDQILASRSNHKVGGPASLEELVSLTKVPGSAPIALIAIANAVDLLKRGARPVTCKTQCESLLFEAYTAPQLKAILTTRFDRAGELGALAAKALGPVGAELRVRQVASRSGDCRQVVSYFEQALFEAMAATKASDEPGAEGEKAVPKMSVQPKRTLNDPLAQVKGLPLEQQMLLVVLASTNGDAMKLPEICKEYKDLCRRLKQDGSLAHKDQVSAALDALEQRGLISLKTLRTTGSPGARRGVRRLPSNPQPSAPMCIAELSVPCKAVRNSLKAASPLLEKLLE